MVLSGMHLWLFSHQLRSFGSCCDNKCYHRLRGLSMPSLIFSLFSSPTRQELHLKFFPMCSQYWKSYNFCPLKEKDIISQWNSDGKNILVQKWHISFYSLTEINTELQKIQDLCCKLSLCTWENNSDYLLKNHNDWYKRA